MNYNKIKTKIEKDYQKIGVEFFDESWEESWTYIRTVVDVLREAVIILDDDCTVLAANEAFYELFATKRKETEGKNIYALGNGQWDIPALKKLLKDIIPKNSFFKGFEVKHNFPTIGHRSIVLNARRIHSKDKTNTKLFPPIIMIAMDDVTDLMSIATKLAEYTNHLEATLALLTHKLDIKVTALEEKVNSPKKK